MAPVIVEGVVPFVFMVKAPVPGFQLKFEKELMVLAPFTNGVVSCMPVLFTM
jgi:hypothetical protein